MQQSKEWHEQRREGIGGSDAPIVMGISPYMTRYELWQEKTGQRTIDRGNFATQRGHDLEPKARAQYELEHGIAMPPKHVVHDVFPFVQANLDGYWSEGDTSIVLEIKCPGKGDHDIAKSGKVPDKYYPQLQHQLLASGAKVSHYYSFDGEKGVLVIVERDEKYIGDMLNKHMEFWDLVKTKTPPELEKRDAKDVVNPDVITFIESWNDLKAKIAELEKKEELLRQNITNCLKDHPRWRYKGITIAKAMRSGSVDYSKIPELSGVDLEKYRKEPIQYWAFTGGGKGVSK